MRGVGMRYLGIMHSAEQGHDILRRLWEVAKPELLAGRKLVVQLKDETRNAEQNSLLWVLLTAFSEQLLWPVNGSMVKLSPEEWKDILTAAYRREGQRVAMGIDGGMVMLGLRTSKLSKKNFAELIEFIQSVAVDRGVKLDAEVEA